MERTLRTFNKTNGRKILNRLGYDDLGHYIISKNNIKNNKDAEEKALSDYNKLVKQNNKNVKEEQKQKNKKISGIKTKLTNAIKKLSKGTDNVNIDLQSVHNDYNIASFIKDILTRIDKLLPNQKILMKVNGVFYALGDSNRQKLIELINRNMETIEENTESDGKVSTQLNIAESLNLSIIKKSHTYNLHQPAFFKYYNKTCYDLSRYDIYKNADEYKGSDVCLVVALRNGGLDEVKIEHLKHMIVGASVPLSQLKVICEALKIQIQVKREKAKNLEVYGKEYSEIYNIGMLDDHYFINEITNNTLYSFKHYEDLTDVENANQVYEYEKGRGRYRRDEDHYINSYLLIKYILENKERFLEKIPYDDVMATQYHKQIKEEITTLQYNEDQLKEIIYEEKDIQQGKYENIFLDFESHSQEERDKKHIPYLCAFILDDGTRKPFYGEDCGLQMLKYLSVFKKNFQFIAHNMTYDYQFLVKHLTKFSEICRGNKLISASGEFGKMKIKIKCSMHLIAEPLRKFGDMFKLEQKKEVMFYDLYNEKKYFDMRYVDKDIILHGENKYGKRYLKPKEHYDFLRNIEEWNCVKDNKVDIIEYSRRYCELDCLVLRDGYNIFREWILDLKLPNTDKSAGLDINNILTCASLAHTYLLKSGCYEGVYQLNGIPQRFIQKTVVGGRTMMRNNKKDYINNPKDKKKKFRKVSDFDGVSLYPSAMNRMDGFLKGKPKVLQTTDYNIIKNYSSYFIEIKIKNLPVKRAFPLVSYKNDKGIRMFSNNIPDSIFIDKIALEDLINFQGLTDFEIIRGYYFEEGFNKKINDTIKYLFNTRLEKIKEENPSEKIYKLIMNSAYGKSIMKEVITENRIIENEKDFNVYVSRNYNYIESVIKIDDCTKFKIKTIKTIDDHSNIAHVGSSVLSWSKRIMNEVMCLAEDLKIEMFYQDTDSIHMFEDKIELLSNEFRKLYGRELIGKNLGQFHTDFDIKYDDKETGKKEKCKDVYSKRLITLGKKAYCDELVGIDNNGNEIVDYHIRMKGISNDCILYTIKELGLNNPIELYERLYNGEAIKFDLTMGKTKGQFKYVGNFTVKTEMKFERTVKFL